MYKEKNMDINIYIYINIYVYSYKNTYYIYFTLKYTNEKCEDVATVISN